MMKSDVGLVSAQHLRSLLLRDCVYLKFSLELKTSFFDNSVFCGLNVEFLRDIVCTRGQSVEMEISWKVPRWCLVLAEEMLWSVG